VQIRDGARDLFKVVLKPTVAAPVRVSSGLSGTTTVGGFSVSPDGKWVVYAVSDSGTLATTWAVDVSGAMPGTPFQVSDQQNVSSFWVQNGSGKLLGPTGPGIPIVNVPNATTTSLDGVSAGSTFLLAPAGSLLAYGAYPSASHVYVRDLDHLEVPAVDIPFLTGPGVAAWRWSLDGKFLATIEGTSSYQLRLVRFQGMTPTTAVAVSTSTSLPSLYWQPLSN
jgi:hypothetical protein